MNHHMRDSSEAARTIRAPSATCQGDRERSVVVSRPAQMVSGHAQLAGENWASRRMCGIYGMVGADAEAVLPRMSATLVHRGPDGDGWAVRGAGGVGCRRLAIIDVAGGAQPLANETGDVIAVCNGEIYNHAALRAALEARGHRFRTRRDAEVLPHLYEDEGIDFVHALDRMFGLAEGAAELRAHLVRAVRAQLVSDVPLGVFLSGGLDSTAVTAVTRSVGGELNTFALGFAERGFDERDHAALAARALGTRHHTLTISPSLFLEGVRDLTPLIDEPLADPAWVPTFLLSRFARTHVKTVLVGEGADELFAGYPTYLGGALAA